MRSSHLRITIVSISALTALSLLAVIGASLIVARGPFYPMTAAWQHHHEICLSLPEEIFHRDRSRAVRGFVHGPDGRPISGALVRCLPAISLLRLARSRSLTPEMWSDLVETETHTNAQGNYEFPHLSEGSRTLCVSSAGLAPDVQSLVLVQDGTGARVDFQLAAPRSLHIRLVDAGSRPWRIGVVPYRWWPELVSRKIAAGETEIELSGLGGPYNEGLVYISDPESTRPNWQLKAAFNLARADDITVSCTANFVATLAVVPEAESVLAWQSNPTEASRLFFGMLTPLALFWRTEASPSLEQSADKPAQSPITTVRDGRLRGYGAGPFLPVLIESREGGAWLEWTTAAAEFELSRIPAGLYRVRAMHSLGKLSFARGLIVSPSELAELKSLVNQCIELDEPLSREVIGTVRWEDGRAAAGAVVYLQDASDFRRFLQKSEVNENGFFTFSDVPPNAGYVIFAQPAQDEHAMKNFNQQFINSYNREIWVDMVLSPHRIIGQLPDSGAKQRVDLLREEPGNEPRVVWSVESGPAGRFEISNVPHGRYLARSKGEGNEAPVVSLPCVIEKELTREVRWAN
jgi:Carboxypeptidase regulatory-like domain